ncbi:MAG: aldo/keto reductase [Actinobacteria bacterium]|nr:aldo/keto reductase [Actinomycetota bacterium]
MQYTRLGSTGMEVSRICLGCMSYGEPGRGTHPWSLDEESSRPFFAQALDLGINFFDTANVYSLGSSEEYLGRAITALTSRDQVVIATKVHGRMHDGPNGAGLSRRAIMTAIDDSLRRLGTDRVDLYQIHRPDMFAHPAQVAETLSSLVGEGKIRAVGVSNHTPAQHDALIAHLGDLPLATSQPEYSPAFLGPLRDGTFDLCMRDGIVPLAWSPLGGGRLMSGENVPAALIATLDELAEREGVDRAAICYAFVLAHPSAPVALLGTQNPDRLRAAVAALDVTLDRNDVYRIVQDSEGVPLP